MVQGNKDIASQFLDMVGSPVQTQVPLRDFSHFRIGGPADYFFEASSVFHLSAAVHLARENNLPFYIIGGGYNLLFSDKGYRGLILKNSIRGIARSRGSELEVYSGTNLHEVLQFCWGKGLSGLEFLAGIPGTVGGAVYGNAGAFEQDIGGCLSKAALFDFDKTEREVDQTFFGFDYRHSRLKEEHAVLLRVSLVVEESEKAKIEPRIKKILEKRKKNHPPWDTACAGSFFKNPVLPDGKKVPAAKFLDEVGAKGLKVGGAVVFDGHANFIINEGEATAQDVQSLAAELKKRVLELNGIELEEEVIYLPEVGSSL